MNRKSLKVSLMGAMLLLCSNVFSNSIDYCTDQSANFIMTHTRQAATDSADIVAFNPAGAALMAPGLYVNVNNQTLLLDYDENFKDNSTGFDESYQENKPITILPNVYMIYNMGKQGEGNLAISLKAGIIAGGGGLEWNGTNGLAAVGSNGAAKLEAFLPGTTLSSTDITQEVTSQYYGCGGNIAYSFFGDKVSVSAGAQGIYAEKTSEIHGKLNYDSPGLGAWNVDINSKFDYEATGYNFIFGLDLRPIEKMTIGLRGETEAALKFKYHQDQNSVTSSSTNIFTTVAASVLQNGLNVEGKKSDYNLPGLVAGGVEYQFTPEFSMAIGGDMFFLRAADMDGYENHYKKIGYEINMGATWAVIPSLLKIGAGVTFADVGGKDSLHSTEDMEESGDNQLIATQGATNITSKILMGGLGVTYTAFTDLDMTVACSYLDTVPGPEKATTDSGYKVSYDRDVFIIAVGANYKLF